MSNRCCLCWIAVLLLSLGWLAPAAVASEANKPPASLDLVPENASFYSCMLRGREQWEAVVNSRAWARLKAMPVVKMLQGLYAMSTLSEDSPAGRIEAALKDPQVIKALDLLGDMFSHEVFFYGEASVAEFLGFMQELNFSMRLDPLIDQLSGEGKGRSSSKAKGAAILSTLAENRNRIQVPEMVMGFKVTDLALAKEELNELERRATAACEQEPTLKGRLKKAAVAGYMYLVLTLDGKMIPWDEIPLDELKKLEGKEGDVDKLIARLKELKITVAVGLRGDYLLVAVGPSTDVLTHLGQGQPLSSRPELAPVKKYAKERLAGVSYVSKAMNARVGTTREDIDNLGKLVDEVMPALELPQEAKDDIRRDVKDLAKDLKRIVTDPGAALALSFLVENGTESYSYSWGDHAGVDASKPLGLLQHVGGNPMLAAVDRAKVSVADYDLLSKWLGVAYRYVEKYALPQMPAKERAKFDKFMADARPLVRRLDDANRKMLLPALSDGQTGLVLDVKLTSKQYVAALPATPKPLPMIEPALVFGVSDAALLRKACTEYRDIADGFLAAAKKIEGAEIPKEFRLPDAQPTTTAAGTLYGYALPKEWGVDPKIMPNAGLSEHVAVLSISPAHSERLLQATPPTVGGRTLPADRPLAGAVMFDFAALIDAITPWVDFGFDKASEQNAGGGAVNMASVREQAHTVLDVLKVFRNVTSESYLEDGVLVGHTRTEIRDVK